MKNLSLNMVADKLLEAVVDYYSSGEYVKPFQSTDLANCVVRHSAAAGVAAMGAFLPGIGGVISLGVVCAATWTMYIEICKIIKVPFGKNKLKSVASALITNLATQLAGVFALSFIPGVGVVASGIVNFTVTYFAGLIFLKLLTNLFKTTRNDNLEFSEDAWKESIKQVLKEIDKKAIIKEAKDIFMGMKNDGTLEQVGKDVEFEKDEE